MKQTVMQYVMIAMMIVGAYLIGVYKTKSELLAMGVGAAPTQQAQEQQANPTVTLEQTKSLFVDGNIVLGDKNAKLLIAEFSDPSCPYCHVAGGLNPELNTQVGPQFTLASDGGSYVPAVPEIKKLVDAGKARFVWMYTPGHGSGELATKAMYCAYEKGKFWEVHDKLMTNEAYDLLNNTVKNDVKNAKVLADYLSPVFSASDMQSCLESGKYDSRVIDDPKTVAKIGQFGTPTFIFNDKLFVGAQPYDQGMQAVVEAAL